MRELNLEKTYEQKQEKKVERKKEKNKVIRPKSRASALLKKVRQTDQQTIFFLSKRHVR